jgi:hypothetical protein
MSCDCIGRCREGFCPCFRLNTPCTGACQKSSPTNCQAECENTLTARRFSSRLSELQAAGEDCLLQDHNFRSESGYSDHFEVLIAGQWVEYVQFAGDPELAAIFVRHNSGTWHALGSSTTLKEVDMRQLISLFTAGSVRADKFLEYLSLSVLESREDCTITKRKFPSGPVEVKDIRSISLQDEEVSRRSLSCNYLYRSLQALAMAAEVYKLLPGATVDISVVKKTMSDWKWTKALFDNGADDHADVQLQTYRLKGLKGGSLDRRSTFSCVAAFESGHCDIEPNLLNGVMALSSGDSIFVAAPLLCDPMEKPVAYELRRILGNVGRTGISMLVPPSNLLIRSVGPEKWNVINHLDFNGRDQDNFKGTSLHLSFTEYNPAVNLGLHGAQDAEVFILESIVSVHDRGKWIADLDILGVLGELERWQHVKCNHGIGELPTGIKKFTAIDSWEEFLDRPEDSIGIARAHCNWVARLTLVATSLSQGIPTILCSRETCWKCFEFNVSTSHDLVVVH